VIKFLRNQRGQTMVEYMLVTLMVVSAIMLVIGRLKSEDFFFKNFISPVVQQLKYNYKYADATALGWDENTSGGPRRHIQISQPNSGQTFRMFLPKKSP
jgi:Flp pilus assembly pilin Flp